MWESLSRADIEQAKEQLSLRREEILSRQAEEIRSLDAEQAEIDNLTQLLAAFASRFKNPAARAPAPAVGAPQETAVPAEVPKEPAAAIEVPKETAAAIEAPKETAAAIEAAEETPATGDEPEETAAAPSETKQPAAPAAAKAGSSRTTTRQPTPQSNFDVFARALSKTI